jgi:hypothetical protein
LPHKVGEASPPRSPGDLSAVKVQSERAARLARLRARTFPVIAPEASGEVKPSRLLRVDQAVGPVPER